MNRRKFIYNSSLASLSVMGLNSCNLNSKNLKITILHTNDVHSQIEPFPSNHNKYPNKGGFARGADLFKEIIDLNQNTLIFVEEIDSIRKKLGENIINNSNDYSEKLFIKELKEKKLISVNNFDKKADIKFNILQQPAFNKRFEILNENLQKHALNNYKINIYFSNKEQSNRFKQILSKYNYNYEFKSIIKPPASSTII